MKKWQDSALALSSSMDVPNSESRRDQQNIPTVSSFRYLEDQKDVNQVHVQNKRQSTSDQMESVSLSWENVNVYVKPKSQILCFKKNDVLKPPKQVLKNVYGLIESGSLVAIIGASGSGKTTLLNVLTSRMDEQSFDIAGDVRVNGLDIGHGVRNISAYVRQDDMFIATMTVKEHLTFRALLRMDKALSRKKRMDRVDEVIQELGLQSCMNSMIGDPGRIKGISGGEMRRLSFASEILNNPPLLFCDEPTSGLDAFMAESIVNTLKNMTNRGKTVLCTIHQPSSELFMMFSHILILAEGRIAFLGNLNEALAFYESNGLVCPTNYNPADFFIMKMAVMPGHEAECKDRVNAICDSFEQSNSTKKMVNDIRNKRESNSSESNVLINHGKNNSDRYEAGWCQQFGAVFARSVKTTIREPVVVRVRLVQTIVVAVLLGLIYLQLTLDQEGVMNINGVLFLMLTNITVTNLIGVLNSFPLETPIFLREYGIGLYRVDVYFISKCLAELPAFLIIPIIFSAITYWMVGLFDSAEAFLIYTGVLVLVANTAVSFGYIVSAAVSSVTTGLAIAPPLIIPLIMFGGFFLNSHSVPVYFIWLEYLSWFKYANELLCVNQWENVDSLKCEGNSTSPADSCHYHDGHQVILYLNYDKDDTWLNVGLLLTMLVAYRLVAFIVLLIRARLSKR